jgi:hypothetical protein
MELQLGQIQIRVQDLPREEQTHKILDSAGFDYELVEDLGPFVVKLSTYSKYAPLLKNLIACLELKG